MIINVIGILSTKLFVCHNHIMAATTMELNPPIEVWCLLIDSDHNPTFGEPFPVLIRGDQTTHDLKIKICSRPNSPESRPDLQVSPNQIEIWKGKTLKLSAKDSFSRAKQLLRNVHFFDSENSVVQHVGVAQRIGGLALKDGELLLALVPQVGTLHQFLCSILLTKLTWQNFRTDS